MGIISHYAAENLTFISEFVAKHNDVCLLSMSKYDKWTDGIDMIASYDYVISSSFLDLIVSDLYGIQIISYFLRRNTHSVRL